MIDQSKQEKQQPQSAAEIRERLQSEIDASRQAIQDLSDEELDAISSGAAVHLPRGAETAIKVVGTVVNYGRKLIKVFHR